MHKPAFSRMEIANPRPLTGRICKYVNRMSIGVAIAVVLVFELLALFVHPFGSVRRPAADEAVMKTANIEQPVFQVMQRSCQNCHSERTEWPWYSHIAPISWSIEGDVAHARNHWNMSRWDQYGPQERQDILAQIAPIVRNRKMPLPKYLLLHPEAKLTDADVDLLYKWSRGERKRLKSESAK